MRFKVDHDYHIHSKLSSCSRDPEQTNENILAYAKKNGLNKICLADHYWDSAVEGASGWYRPQNFDHLSLAKPLPQGENIEFLFGCECEMDKFFTIGIPPERYEDFDFIIIPTTHLHMSGFTIDDCDKDSNKRRAELWVKRFEALLDSPLPFGKVGIAHPACSLINHKSRQDFLDTLSLISDEDMERLFKRTADEGLGIELNQSDMSFSDDEADIVLRPFRIAKKCGCKFYLGSDSHHPKDFVNAKEIFERAVTLLELSEDDKFHILST